MIDMYAIDCQHLCLKSGLSFFGQLFYQALLFLEIGTREPAEEESVYGSVRGSGQGHSRSE
jgi:hypothetical protein